MRILTAPDTSALTRYLDGQLEACDAQLAAAWGRSLRAGASWQGPTRSKQDPFLPSPKLKERQEQQDMVLRFVQPVLTRLSQQLERCGFLGIWADAEGVILHRQGGGEFLSHAQRLELVEGACWGEGARGTNAIGTALEEGEDLGVLGAAHLQQPNHELVCYAALVRSPDGQILGVLDATSRQEYAQGMAMATVLAARHAIELELKAAAYARTVNGGLEALSAILERCPCPAILIERDGTRRSLNLKARQWLAQAPRERVEQLAWHKLSLLERAEGDGQGWRANIEWIGQPSPHAALLFLEPVVLPISSPPKPAPQARHQPSTPRAEAKPAAPGPFDKIIGDDEAIVRAKTLTQRFATTSLPVLYLAKTGCGKELFARALHACSTRAEKPLVTINCGALSEQLLEAELFGYGPGAFTGAKAKGHDGKLAAADGGTLFLDEVAELSLKAQAALLRFLEYGVFYRVGESEERRADVRIVAATCRDVEAMIKEGSLRADLYYRLKGVTIRLPMLAQRQDLAQLIDALLGQLSAELGRSQPINMSAAALGLMRRYEWPGNIRELKNTLRVALVLAQEDDELRPEHLPEELNALAPPAPPAKKSVAAMQQSAVSWAEAEAKALKQALEQARGNLSEAARVMGVARSTLYRMLDRHDLR